MNIPVVYATSNDYKYMMITAIASLSVLRRISKDDTVDFYYLINKDCPEENKREISRILLDYSKNCSVQFLCEGIDVEKTYAIDDYISRETHYRLFLPDILSNVDKCVYLDSDTIACANIKSFFEMIPDDKYVLGVKAPAFHMGLPDEYARQAHLPDLKKYINAGVLGMNLKLMRQDRIMDRIKSLMNTKMENGDQDCINSACYDKIAFAEYKYNYMTKYALWKVETYKGLFSEKEILEAKSDPYIIHYADRKKPWNDLTCSMSNRWWNICIKAGLYNYFLSELSESVSKR